MTQALTFYCPYVSAAYRKERGVYTKVLEWRSLNTGRRVSKLRTLGEPTSARSSSSPNSSRYKGRTSLKSLEQDFPHIVEMIVPESDFGKQLEAMYEWHIHQGIRAINSTGRRDENGRNYYTLVLC